MIDISKDERSGLRLYYSLLMPAALRMPDTAREVIYHDLPDQITEGFVRQVLYSQLLYLRGYVSVVYDRGRSEKTPGWAIEYMMGITDQRLYAATHDSAAQRELFSQMVAATRLQRSDRAARDILTILRAQGEEGLYAAAQKVAIDIIGNFMLRPGAGLAARQVRAEAAWKSFSRDWVTRFIENHGDLPREPQSRREKEIFDGYAFLATGLVNMGGTTYEQAAEMLNTTPAAVENLLHP